MSKNDYRYVFISEGREHLAEIFSDLNKLDRAVKVDENLLFDMFRRFHTLKGMANTMGQKELGEIAHLLEEMLEYIRRDPQTLNSLKEFIRKGINSVSNEIDNYERSLPFSSFDIIKELEYIIDDIKKRFYDNVTRGALTEKTVIDLSNTFEVIFQILPTCKSPSVRAFILIREISRFNPVATSPSIEEIKSGGRPEFVKVYLKSEMKGDELTNIVSRVSEIILHSKGWYNKELKSSKRPIRYIRVPFERVEEVTGALDELFLLWNKYVYSISQADINPLLSHIEYGFRKLLDCAGRMRTVPISTIIPKLNALVDSIARPLNKKIKLEIYNEDVEIDKSIIDRLEEPLMHIIRNSIYHGIEEPSVRKKTGKPEEGKISIVLGEQEEYIEIKISDDGCGLDREKILNSAIEKGIIEQHTVDNMKDEDVFELIFVPGFSTIKTADMTSGRGFGMDIVKNVLWQIGGDVVLSSRKNLGLDVYLRIPYQFASRKVIIANVGGYKYAFPVFDIEAICSANSVRYLPDKSSIIKDNNEYKILNYKYRKVSMLLLSSYNQSRVAVGIDDILFIGETRLYKVPYLLKSSNFINGMIIVNGICPVPVISLRNFVSKRYL